MRLVVHGGSGRRGRRERCRVVAEGTPPVLVAGAEAAEIAAGFGVETGVDLLTDR
ncbi:hypothetical protein ACFQL0_03190 [Haloplanus litoreus]|uniref:hypothetical protein n=1 Tax=Haloplanus litoreus TaxID=767515 RepID=UPI0036230ABD